MEEQKQEALNANAAAGVPERENIVGSEEEHQRTWDESEISAKRSTNTQLVRLRQLVVPEVRNCRSVIEDTRNSRLASVPPPRIRILVRRILGVAI